MRVITVAGPPSCGKTSLIIKSCAHLIAGGTSCSVIKFDCLQSRDDALYEAANIPVTLALSAGLCPDHFFATNMEEAFDWARQLGAACCIIETAGLCNRCSPHIKGLLAVCVIDNLMGIDAPEKIGPMLRMADLVAITKGDLVSQAEREVYRYRIRQWNKRAIIRHVNGLTGQGCRDFAAIVAEAPSVDSVTDMKLRFPMPGAICSYCLSERRIGAKYQKGNVKKASFGNGL